jgi:hypothetical protein
MVAKRRYGFLTVCGLLFLSVVGPAELPADSLLSPNLAKSTTWVSLFAKKDQERLRSLISSLDKTRTAMVQDTQTALESLSVYGDKVRLLEALLDRYRFDEGACIKAEQWLELPNLAPLEAQKELSRLKLLYLANARAFADYQFGHRSGGELITYSKQEEILVKNGKTLAEFIGPRISSLGKSALKPLALSLASRLELHPDCPSEITELALRAEKLTAALYRQWIIVLAGGSPAGILPTAFKGLKDTAEGREFERAITQFNASYTQKRQIRELLPSAIILGLYTDRLAQFADTGEPIPPLHKEFLEQFFSSDSTRLGKACSADSLFRRALVDFLTTSWVYGTRPELWQDGRWPFGALGPASVRAAIQQVLAETGSNLASDFTESPLSQPSWEAVHGAEAFVLKIQRTQDLSSLLSAVSELLLQDQACALFLESPRYETYRINLFQKLNRAFYQAPLVSALVPLSFNQAFLFMQWQSKDLLAPELLGLLLQANKKAVTKELQPWLRTYLLALGPARGIPEGLLINQTLYGTETNCNLFIQANNSSLRLVYYTNRLGIQE